MDGGFQFTYVYTALCWIVDIGRRFHFDNFPLFRNNNKKTGRRRRKKPKKNTNSSSSFVIRIVSSCRWLAPALRFFGASQIGLLPLSVCFFFWPGLINFEMSSEED